MAELYDWSKENGSHQTFQVTGKGSFEECTYDVKRVEIPGRDDILLIKESATLRKYNELLKGKTPRNFNLVGGITTAINRAFKKINALRTGTPNISIPVMPYIDGRLYFTIDGYKYYLGKDQTSCVDEDGKLWLLDMETGKMYGGKESSLGFDFAFVSEEAAEAYENSQRAAELAELFSRTRSQYGKIVDFESARKDMQRKGR